MGGIISRIAILDVDIAVYKVSLSCDRETNLDRVKETMDLFLKSWLTITNSDKYVGYITDSKTNFRIARAFTWPYKGQRSKEKPKWLKAMREYVVEEWGCQNVQGMEADDALTIAAEFFKSQGTECVIVTEDKDLLQYPCLHYNPNKSNEVFTITPEQGHYNLWHQVITGDRTDNIPGVSHAITESAMGLYNQGISKSDLHYKEKMKLFKKYPAQEQYGKATAEKYLKQFEPHEYPQKVWELYIDKYEDLEDEGSTGYGDLRFCETFDLIYMLVNRPLGVEVLIEPREPPSVKGITFLDF